MATAMTDPPVDAAALWTIGRRLLAELDPETVLERLLEQAQQTTGARYVALGVLNDERTELARFLTRGIDPEAAGRIGEPPRGLGVLGVLIDRPRPLRLEDLGAHAASFGFPAQHPAMRTFLGVPILIDGEVWGNLYCAEKAGGEPFDAADERAATVLAEVAATAIENARRHRAVEQRRTELEATVRALDAARHIADAIGAESELDRILELIVTRGCALIDAQAVFILLRDGDDLVTAASAGQSRPIIGQRIPIATSTSGEVLMFGDSVRVAVDELKVQPGEVGVTGALHALIVPMVHRDERIGVLLAFDRGVDGDAFTDADEALLRTYAASAASAVAISHGVQADRLRAAIAAAEAERRRWARELHDETLQALGALRVMLATALRQDDPEWTRATVAAAVADIEGEIDNLRAIITELRPMLLDDLGLVPAIEALAERRRVAGLAIDTRLDLSDLDGHPLSPEFETAVYRLIQEALTNVAKHARADAVEVRVGVDEGVLTVTVADDGAGFDPAEKVPGFGLAGIRERVYLLRGSVELRSAPGAGTTLTATLPLAEHELRFEVPAP
jgi:signal transduction histidine kinase